MIHLSDALQEAIARGGAKLTLGTGWHIDIDSHEAWFTHEGGDSHSFVATSAEYQLAQEITVAGHGQAATLPVAPVLRLARIGAIRVVDKLHESTARFRWQDEYFAALASPANTVRNMNENLISAHVAIVGVGGLGSMLALLLAASGVGHLILVDGDLVEESNLPRQFLFPESSVGRPKVDVLREFLLTHNSKTRVTAVHEFVDSEQSLQKVCDGATFLALCADQPRIKIRAWAAAVVLKTRLPSIAMASTWIGPITVPFQSPCYVCQARTYRSRISDQRHFVRRSLDQPLPVRAAFGPGIAATAGFLASAIIRHLAGVLDVQMYSRAFKVGPSGDVDIQEYRRYRDCPRLQSYCVNTQQLAKSAIDGPNMNNEINAKPAPLGMPFLLVVAMGTSAIGSAMTAFAVGIWAFSRTGSYDAYALIGMLSTGAVLIFAPIAGYVADRFPKRRVLLCCDSIAICTVIVVGIHSVAECIDDIHSRRRGTLSCHGR